MKFRVKRTSAGREFHQKPPCPDAKDRGPVEPDDGLQTYPDGSKADPVDKWWTVEVDDLLAFAVAYGQIIISAKGGDAFGSEPNVDHSLPVLEIYDGYRE